MEFWGVEVKSGEPLKVVPGEDMVLHLSQACIGEQKKEKGKESVYLSVNVDGKKLVLGTLFTDKLPQQQFDLIFDRDFELSHNWKNGSVYFFGYKASQPVEEDEFREGEFDISDSDEDIPLTLANNEKPGSKPKQEKSISKESNSSKKKVKIVEPKKDVNPHLEYDTSSTEDMMSEDDDSENEGGEDDINDVTDESDEETPKKVESSKKRPAESAIKTPVPDKKAKVTPQKTDGKKAGGHVATPHPGKGKTPANKPNPQTPKSGGSHSCKDCKKTFGSEKGLESHSKAKHA